MSCLIAILGGLLVMMGRVAHVCLLLANVGRGTQRNLGYPRLFESHIRQLRADVGHQPSERYDSERNYPTSAKGGQIWGTFELQVVRPLHRQSVAMLAAVA